MAGSIRRARPGWLTLRVVGVAAGLLALTATAAACAKAPVWQQPGDTGSSSAARQPAALTLSLDTLAPQPSPSDPITATVANGTIDSVTLTNTATNKAVAGELSADKKTWTNSEQLGYDKPYQLVVSATGDDGQHKDVTKTFTTLKPKNMTLPYLRANVGTLLNGGTFGVGQPITVWFDERISDKAAAEKTLSVTTDPSGIVGGWYWMDDHEVHWRPKDYWPTSTKVTVTAKVYGKDMGGGIYGQQDVTASFKIADHSHLAVADHDTKHMKVYQDGVQITSIAGHDVTAGIPISMGKGGSETQPSGVVVDFRTNSGPHVITLSYDVYRMTSASFGITNPASPNFYDVNIKKAMRISGDGEFVHSRDWDVSQMGNLNTSHGCVNVPVVYMDWFYTTFRAGDVVDVKNTGKNLDLRNGLGDWTVSWDNWLKGSALAGSTTTN
jgi:lipoprotein-anchoring transpeptidase ErfK/SrfK